MTFPPNEHTQGDKAMFSSYIEGPSSCQEMGQSLNSISNLIPLGSLDSFNSRQFVPVGFDGRTYLNSSLFEQDHNNASSSLQSPLLNSSSADVSIYQNILTSASGYPSQTLRIIQNNNGNLPFLNQSPLVSNAQQPYSDYENISVPDSQSQTISVTLTTSQSPTNSFVRRYPDSINMVDGIDPSSFSSGVEYSNQDFNDQLSSLNSFGKNNLSPYADDESSISNSIRKFKTGTIEYTNNANLDYESDKSQLIYNGSQSEGNAEGHYPQAYNFNQVSSKNFEFRGSSLPLILIQPSDLSQYSNETIAPMQLSYSPVKNLRTKSTLSPKPKMTTNASKTRLRVFDPTPNPIQTLKASPTGQKLKRPMNAFLIYASERRPQLQQADPTMTTAAQSKILGDEWSKMDESHKQVYMERARTLKSQFLETNPDYVYTRRPNNIKKKYRRHSAVDGNSCSPKLRRPMNAYLLFNKEMRHKLLETNPYMSVAEISKEIGDRWKNLNEEERNRYFIEAQSIKRDFLVTNPDFVYTRRSKAEIEAEKKRSIDGENDSMLIRDPRGRKKKKQKNPTAPKHPMSGFLFYLAAVRPQVVEQYPGSTVGPISKIIANQWNSMRSEERSPWEQKASEDKARYAREMKGYLAERQ